MNQYLHIGWVFQIWRQVPILLFRREPMHCIWAVVFLLSSAAQKIELDAELNIFEPSFYKKLHIRIWELFFPNNTAVKNIHALHLNSSSNSFIFCKGPVIPRRHKEVVRNTHEENALQRIGNTLSAPTIKSWLLPCTSPLAWKKWHLRARVCDREGLH